MTERMRSRIQVTEMGFLRWVTGLSLKDRMRSSVIQERVRIELLPFLIEISQLRWFRHLLRMPSGHLPGEEFLACPTGRKPRGRPRVRRRDYPSHLAWERLGIPLEAVAGVREVWASLLSLLPLYPNLAKQKLTL